MPYKVPTNFIVMSPLPVKKRKSTCSFGKISIKLIVLTFIGLIIYVSFNMMLSSARMSVIVDMSIKMRSNVIDVLNSIVNLSSADSLNGTFSLKSIPAKENKRQQDEHSVLFQFTDEKLNSFHKNLTAREKQLSVDSVKEIVRNHQERNGNKSNHSEVDAPKLDDNTLNKTRGYGNDVKKIPEKVEKNDIVNKYGNKANTKTKTRQHNCTSCFEHNFNYVIQNKNICQLYSTNQTIELLILIMTTHKNNRARAALRSTWLSVTKHNKGNVRYAFLLGEITDKWQKEAVLEENNIHHDIIKEDFIDTYMNLTYKTIMGFKWATVFCQTALYVMKTDDDMFVNISNLLKMLTDTNKEKLQTSVMGACNSKARPIRSQKSKWFASEDSYPDKFYPGFCSGTGYVTSMHVAKEVYLISPSVPFFHLEDVYVSLCIRKLGFKLQAMPGYNAGRPKLDPCVYKGDKLITAHQLSPIMLQMIWGKQCIRKPT
ncbi:beta-1,3-galactosyltransferase 1-like [Ruditapes philippinarum]|uniref:beta-1,3-galactosyltransferase 1-like n=1 Tax=Ruditapes philippinarum TaxID=129788 RepID=UPI00295B349D|nr:beta-1,3-galactosyltransferase 1-like [Ruditapes philippinarum]XP_060597818.1 beta-1,3-galactosyltransferase 1-like [Ruditapes philippinarum]XP_060597819.1 beta-1,3-galactosyltransferase 1-like [Ruditapes philippinarum]XP_060597820.1 beta-1,3-galactosyltransferase 1-like [Ruditapes philippinarum]